MIKSVILSLSLSCNLIEMNREKIFYLEGDYSQEAKDYMDARKPSEYCFDPNDILYRTIAKELEEKDKDQLDK